MVPLVRMVALYPTNQALYPRKCLLFLLGNVVNFASDVPSSQVWNVESEGRKLGILVRTLVGHGHRVNTLALSCEAALRTGPFGKEECALKASSTYTPEEAQAVALERYNLAR